MLLLVAMGFAYGFLRYEGVLAERNFALLEVSKLRQQIELLQQENYQLSRINNPPATATIAHHKSSVARTEPAITSEQIDFPANESLQAENSFVDLMLTRINSRVDSEMFADMATSFNDEVIDLDWAEGQEELIASAFDSESLNQVVPESILCRNTRCQIRIPSIDSDEASTTSLKVSTAMASISRLSQTRITSRFNQESSMVELYFFRENEPQ